MDQDSIENFWDTHPCGETLVGGLDEKYRGEYRQFFEAYDKSRYTHERHILDCLDAVDWQGKQVLEIGLGQGADSEQLIRRGAIWSGLDLTEESVRRVETRLALHELPSKDLRKGSALEIPYESNSFDLIFSHGVLHHIPDIITAQREIARVLKPDGELVIMLYAKWSLNYLVSIGIVRRLGLLLLQLTGVNPGGIYAEHLANAKRVGLWNYLKLRNFIHRNTDGPSNPYSKVYGAGDVVRDFPDFRMTRRYRRFMHAPPLPVAKVPLQGLLGWHLWVHLKPAS